MAGVKIVITVTEQGEVVYDVDGDITRAGAIGVLEIVKANLLLEPILGQSKVLVSKGALCQQRPEVDDVSDPLQINLTTGDGQVPTTATQITAGIGNHARRMNITCANVGGQEEVLVLTLRRNGGTARRLKRVVLQADEQLEIGGLPLNGGLTPDSLLAQTTNADSVDYTVSVAAPNAPLTMHVYDDKGGLKTAPYILEQMEGALG